VEPTDMSHAGGCLDGALVANAYEFSQQFEGGYADLGVLPGGTQHQYTVHVVLTTSDRHVGRMGYARIRSLSWPTLTWAPSTHYDVGDIVVPTAAKRNGRAYRVVQASSTGSTEPNWPDADGANVASLLVEFIETTIASVALNSDGSNTIVAVAPTLLLFADGLTHYELQVVQTIMGIGDDSVMDTRKVDFFSADHVNAGAVTATGIESQVWDSLAGSAYVETDIGVARMLRVTTPVLLEPLADNELVFSFIEAPVPGLATLDTRKTPLGEQVQDHGIVVTVDVVDRDSAPW
jgi:hypothetical protein